MAHVSISCQSQLLPNASRGQYYSHSFRHYFVTMVLRGSGGNLKPAQELARHKDTSPPALCPPFQHELDRGYFQVIDRGNS
jgi:integrase